MNVKQIIRVSVAITAVLLTASYALCQGHGGGQGKHGGYTLVPLPDASGNTGINGYAEGLNEMRDSNGALLGVEIVGSLGGRAHYWQLDATGAVLDAVQLPLPIGADPALSTDAFDINNDGLIIGVAGVWPVMRPVVWPNPSSEPLELTLPVGFEGSGYGVNVNNNGLAVGWLSGTDGTKSIVAWGINLDWTIIGPVFIGQVDQEWAPHWAPDINDAGQVVVTTGSYAQGDLQGCRWQVDWNGVDLTVSSAEMLTANGWALRTVTGINEHGDICGTYKPDGWQAYVLTAEGQLIDMPSLIDNRRNGTRNYQANDLNDAATTESIQVLGQGDVYRKRSGIIDRSGIRLLWQGSKATDLEAVTAQPNSQLNLSYFSVVGDAGWLAGFGKTANFDPRYRAGPKVSQRRQQR